MVVTSIGINKSQKKFAPKIKAKVVKKKEEATLETKEDTFKSENEDSETKLFSEKTIQGFNQVKEGTLGFKNEIKGGLIKDNKDEQTCNLDINKVPFVPILPKPDEFLKPSAELTQKLISKPKGTLISAPSSSNNLKKEENRKIKSDFEEESEEEEDLDMPFDIMAYYRPKEHKALNQVKTTQRRRKSKPLKVVDSNQGNHITLLDKDNINLEQLLQATIKVVANGNNKIKVQTNLRNGLADDLAPGVNEGIYENFDSSHALTKARRSLQRPLKSDINSFAVKELNKYKKKRKIEINNIPIGALCATKINYGEKMQEDPRFHSKPKIESIANDSLSIKSQVESDGSKKPTKSKAAQVKIVDGKIVLDEASLQITHNELVNAENNTLLQRIDLGDSLPTGNCSQYVKKTSNKRWTPEEVDLFYMSLIKWGTDFQMIAHEFADRTRVHIKRKFHKEESINPDKVYEAIYNKRYTPLTSFPQSFSPTLGLKGKDLSKGMIFDEDSANHPLLDMVTSPAKGEVGDELIKED